MESKAGKGNVKYQGLQIKLRFVQEKVQRQEYVIQTNVQVITIFLTNIKIDKIEIMAFKLQMYFLLQ